MYEQFSRIIWALWWFDTTNNLMGCTGCAQLPLYMSSSDLAQCFSNHFKKTVNNIRQSRAHCDIDRSYSMADAFRDENAVRYVQLSLFIGVNESDVSSLIAVVLCKSCRLDPLPT